MSRKRYLQDPKQAVETSLAASTVRGARRAMRSLAPSFQDEAVTALRAALFGTRSRKIFHRATAALAEIGSERAQQALVEFMESGRYPALSVIAVAKAGGKVCSRALVNRCDPAHGDRIQWKHIQALAKLGDPLAYRRMVEVARNSSRMRRFLIHREVCYRHDAPIHVDRLPVSDRERRVARILLNEYSTVAEKGQAIQALEEIARLGGLVHRFHAEVELLRLVRLPSERLSAEARLVLDWITHERTLLRSAGPARQDSLLRAAQGLGAGSPEELLRAATGTSERPSSSLEGRSLWSRMLSPLRRIFERASFVILAVILAQVVFAGSEGRLEISPHTLVLNGADARVQVVATYTGVDGVARDVTRTVRWTASRPGILRLTDTGVASPVQDGEAKLTARWNGAIATALVTVRHCRERRRWSFRNHVQSVFSKNGCNSGPCHGAQSGKGGFRLSLRAYDSESDYERVVLDLQGRRISRRSPAKSLILRKPSLQTAHAGGLRLKAGSEDFETVSYWIRKGSPPPSMRDASVVSLRVTPSDQTLAPRAKTQLRVEAIYSNGTVEDVTRWARYASNEESLARIGPDGLAEMLREGEAPITVWYSGRVAFARLRVPFRSFAKPRSDTVPPPANYVDHLIRRKLAGLRLSPGARCDDRTFIRRVFLDLAGLLPEPEEVRSFAEDRSPNKRAALVEALIGRGEFTDLWTNRLCELLRVSRDALGMRGMRAVYEWVREGIASNRPWNAMVRELVTATGSADGPGPAAFFAGFTGPEEMTESISQSLLGLRVQCAHCHNHPFENLTQAEYYRMAGLFTRVGKSSEAGQNLIVNRTEGEIDYPKLGRPLPPAPFGGPILEQNSRTDRRDHLAVWMTSPSNPFTARSFVNRIWRHLMGRGLVEPPDEMRLTNPPTNEPLLNALTEDFAKHGWDLQRLIRTIVRSEAYQARSEPVKGLPADERFFSRYLPRRLSAEVLLDAVSQVTGVPERFEQIPFGVRAVALPDTRVASGFLDAFGRPPRQIACECERTNDSGIAQSLHLLNGETINRRVRDPDGWLSRRLAKGGSDGTILSDLYLRALGREPARDEAAVFRARLAAAIQSATDPEQARLARAEVFGDLFWALLSCPEFLFNH